MVARENSREDVLLRIEPWLFRLRPLVLGATLVLA